MNKRFKSEMKDWLGIFGWTVFVISFLLIIIKIKTIN